MSQSIPRSEGALAALPQLKIVTPDPEQLVAQEREKALTLMHRDSYYSQTVVTLTTGLFLTGFALQFQAPNSVIGLLVAIPFLAQLVQLPAISLLKKYRSRREVCAWTTLLSRLFLVPMIFTPWLPSSQLALGVLLLSFVCHTGVGALATCAWNGWLKDVVPTEKLGAFFSGKLSLAMLITIILTMLGGYFVDSWTQHFPGGTVYSYSVLFGIALLAGILGVPPLFRIPELKATLTPSRSIRKPISKNSPKHFSQSISPNFSRNFLQSFSWLTVLRKPLRNANFRQLILFMGGWNFAVNLAAPFFAVYMLTMLKYSMALVTCLTIISQISSLFFVKLWGRLADRFSNKSVLSVCAPLYLLCVLGWTFVPYQGSVQATLPAALILHLLLGLASAGVTLASGNMALKLAPAKKSSVFLALHSMVSSVAAGVAPILGGLFADFFAQQELSLVLQWHNSRDFLNVKTLDFQYWDFFFAMAFLLGLLALGRLARIQEPGGVGKTMIIREFCSETKRSLTKLPQCMHTEILLSNSGHLFRFATGWMNKVF